MSKSHKEKAREGEICLPTWEKYGLRQWYEEIYRMYRANEGRAAGEAVELGSGGGFAKQRWPELWTTDVVAYPGLDLIADGTRMPFVNGALRFVGMCNVLHHVPDVNALFQELSRCLTAGGRVVILDQHVGWISRWVLRYAHHEPFDPEARTWKAECETPLSGANGAIASIVFRRDAAQFAASYPEFEVLRYRPHSPLRYWLAGGLRPWSLLGRWN